MQYYFSKLLCATAETPHLSFENPCGLDIFQRQATNGKKSHNEKNKDELWQNPAKKRPRRHHHRKQADPKIRC
jgi:hypothetical protein